MIPESHQDLSVRLYKAISFPEKWEHVCNLLSGYHFVDSSIIRYKDKWWLFLSTTESDVLNLYYADDLFGEWKAHPMNPIIKFNKHISRPGGRIIEYEGHIFRMAQDDQPDYGIQVFAFEITDLSETSYKERIVSSEPVIGKTGKGWNAKGMHHIDLMKIGNKWISAVDGKDR
jgi:hypothetical protein